MASGFISRMAITNDLPSVFCWASQMASSFIRVNHHALVIIKQNPAGIAFHVFVLTLPYRPDQHHEEDQAEEHHAGNQAVNHIHGSLYGSVRFVESLFLLDSGLRRNDGLALNKVRMRAALPITTSELIGMVIAATSGVTSASIASGTMIAL